MQIFKIKYISFFFFYDALSIKPPKLSFLIILCCRKVYYMTGVQGSLQANMAEAPFEHDVA